MKLIFNKFLYSSKAEKRKLESNNVSCVMSGEDKAQIEINA